MLPRVGRRGCSNIIVFSMFLIVVFIFLLHAKRLRSFVCQFTFCFVLFFHNFKQFFISNYRTSGYLLSTAQVHVAMLRAVKAASVVELPPLTLPQSQVNSQITLELFGVGVIRMSR